MGLVSAPVSSAPPISKLPPPPPPQPQPRAHCLHFPLSGRYWHVSNVEGAEVNRIQFFRMPRMLNKFWWVQKHYYFRKLKISNHKASVVQRSNLYPWRKMMQYFPVCKRNQFKVYCSQVKVEESLVDEACELVNGTELTIGNEADCIQAYLFKAVKNNNGTGILLLSDIFGFEDSSTRDFAYRVACNGYNVLVPDLFNGDPWTKDRPMALLEEWISRQEPQRIVKDVLTSAEWMVNEFANVGISNKLGIIGFCFGGGRVIDVLAQDQGSYFGTGVSFYGTRIDSSVASNIKAPLLLIAGDNDALCPVDVLEEISKSNKESKTVIFGGRGHGFGHRPQTPEEDADAEEAFMVMRNWLNNDLHVNN